MNLILHHFKKEFRYLRHRWFAFLGLLGLDLAVNLEWLFPLDADGAPPQALKYLPLAVALVGLTLLGSCPEDRPGSDRSFISTRPLPQRAYWLGRVGVWLLLLVLPVFAQNAVYLALSGRPLAEVILGAGERGFLALALTAWVLPMTVLWRRGEFWAALGSLGAVLFLTDRLAYYAAVEWRNVYFIFLQSGGLALGSLVFTLGIVWLTWRHQSGRLAGFCGRLLVFLGFGLAGVVAARAWSWHGFNPPQNETLVRKLAPGLKPESDITSLYGYEYDLGKKRIRSMFIGMRAESNDPAVSVLLRPQNATLTQDGSPPRDVTPELYWRSHVSQLPAKPLKQVDTILRDFFPAGTLFVAGSRNQDDWEKHEMTSIADFQQPFPDREKPLRLTVDYAADWYQRGLELDIPLQAGSAGQSDDHAWRIIRVHENKDARGEPALGQVSVELHVRSRVEDRAHKDNIGPLRTTAALLYSPQRRLVWLDPILTEEASERGFKTGWRRYKVRYEWSGVLNYADGEEAGVETSQLRLILLRSRYLGASEWTWKSPDIRLADHHHPHLYLYRESIYDGRAVKAFRDRLATLQAPGADSSEREARRYLYDLLAVIHATDATRRPPVLKEVEDAFRPLLEHHLPLMLELPSELWPGKDDQPPKTLLDEYLTEEHREDVIDRLPLYPGLAHPVVRKGWAEAARRLQPRLLNQPRPLMGIDDLLLAWGDEASHEKLLQMQRQSARGGTFAKLDQVPALRPRLESLAGELIREEIPVVPGFYYEAPDFFTIAANFGSREALDVCLRWMALGGRLPFESIGVLPSPHLLRADGVKLWQKDADPDEQWPRYRHLKAGDFDYLPEQRAWKLRQP